MNWRSIVTLLLLAGAIVSGWSVWTQRNKDAAPTGAPARSDYVLIDFELTALNAQGKESFTLQAPRLARDPYERTMDIATPLFLIPPGENSRGDAWEVRARNGWVSADGDEVRLRGAVKADSRGSDGPVAIRTPELNVFPNAHRATSAAAVTITQPGHILTGRDLEAQLDSGRIRLKNVQSRYEKTLR
jgi:lipopolysaccharide export system protein LptC